jgi:hypothetical protein
LTFADFAYSGLCLAVGAVVGGVGVYIYSRARATSAPRD